MRRSATALGAWGPWVGKLATRSMKLPPTLPLRLRLRLKEGTASMPKPLWLALRFLRGRDMRHGRRRHMSDEHGLREAVG